jgi:arylsulfatase A-like enzyme
MLRLLAFLPCFAATLSAVERPRPNIVLILADDMGTGDLSHAGGKAPTPHIDRLAAEGMRFTDAHSSSSVCTPTRYGLLTGRYNWRSTLKSGVLGGNSPPLLEAERLTVAEFLRDAGYRTAVVGKWHLGLGWSRLPQARKAERGPTQGDGWGLDYAKPVARGPLAEGFAESFIISASLDMAPFVYLRNDRPVAIPTVTKKWLRAGPAAVDFEAVECLADFARESRDFIRRGAEAADGRPFFLYLPLTSPHTPIVPARRWRGKSGIGDYGDFLMETDWVVGEVLAELEARGLARDTLVVFTADNGCSPQAGIPALEARGHRPNLGWRGTKADLFEAGHRVPFLVRWPAAVKGGTTTEATICLNDIFATVAETIGMKEKLPAHAAEDSFSLLPLLTGGAEYGRRFTVHHSIQGAFAIRQGKWKLCLCPDSGGWSEPKPGSPAARDAYPVQLYDLEADPGETTNLAASEPQRVKELAGILARAIRDGRTTPGPAMKNDGKAITFPPRVLKLLPELLP